MSCAIHLWNFKNTTPPPSVSRPRLSWCTTAASLFRNFLVVLQFRHRLGFFFPNLWNLFQLDLLPLHHQPKGQAAGRRRGEGQYNLCGNHPIHRIINSATRHHPRVLSLVFLLVSLLTGGKGRTYLHTPCRTQAHTRISRFALFSSWSCIIYHPLR